MQNDGHGAAPESSWRRFVTARVGNWPCRVTGGPPSFVSAAPPEVHLGRSPERLSSWVSRFCSASAERRCGRGARILDRQHVDALELYLVLVDNEHPRPRPDDVPGPSPAATEALAHVREGPEA